MPNINLSIKRNHQLSRIIRSILLFSNLCTSLVLYPKVAYLRPKFPKSTTYYNNKSPNKLECSLTVKDDDVESTQSSGYRLFIFGYGNLGQQVARLLLTTGTSHHSVISSTSHGYFFDRIYASTRNITDISDSKYLDHDHPEASSCNRLTLIPFQDSMFLQTCLLSCTHILITIPPTILTTSDTEYNNNNISNDSEFYKDPILDHNNLSVYLPQWLVNSQHNATKNKKQKWIGYISTTSVYGNHNNQWVDENSETKCNTTHKNESTANHGKMNHFRNKATVFLHVEERWKNFISTSSSSHLRIFRCSGLYGPHASALHTILKNGWDPKRNFQIHPTQTNANLDLQNNQYTSRIHVEDAARAIVASMIQTSRTQETSNVLELTTRNNPTCEIYNLADDEPASRDQVLSFAAHLLGSKGYSIPSFSTPQVDENDRHRRRKYDKKRVLNQKMKEQLLFPHGLKYPNYRIGLMSILHTLEAENRDQAKQ